MERCIQKCRNFIEIRNLVSNFMYLMDFASERASEGPPELAIGLTFEKLGWKIFSSSNQTAGGVTQPNF